MSKGRTVTQKKYDEIVVAKNTELEEATTAP